MCRVNINADGEEVQGKTKRTNAEIMWLYGMEEYMYLN